jgi:hypothetical protein
MLRDLGLLSNTPVSVRRAYRDQKEKARYGIIWAKGDDDAERLIEKFFLPERIIKRIQLLFEHKNKKSGKYKHLTLYGFYLQLKQRSKLLYLIDWPLIECDRLVVAKIENPKE